MSKETFNLSGIPEHHNGTATTSAATVTFSNHTQSIWIANVSTEQTLLVSFDNGNNYYTMFPTAYLTMHVNIESLKIKTITSTADYNIITSIHN